MHTFLLKAAPTTFQCTIQSTTYILHIEEFLGVLLHAENVKQTLLYNCVLPDDGRVRPKTCRI